MSLHCCMLASFSCGRWGSSLVTARRLLIEMMSLVVERRFQTDGLQQLQHADSVAVEHRLACGIFPDQGSNLCPLHWQADFHLIHCTTREIPGDSQILSALTHQLHFQHTSTFPGQSLDILNISLKLNVLEMSLLPQGMVHEYIYCI